MRSIVLCLLCYSFVDLSEEQTGTNAKDLRQKLFVTDKYDKKVRSANDQTDPTGKSLANPKRVLSLKTDMFGARKFGLLSNSFH